MNKLTLLIACSLLSGGCHFRHTRYADDITPGNPCSPRLDWQYGARDMKIQTTKITKILMDRWSERTGARWATPRIVITQIDNRTDRYIPLEMIRDVFETVAVTDGRFQIVVGDAKDERELDALLNKSTNASKYKESTRIYPGSAEAPEFLAKVRLTRACNEDRYYIYETWRMQVTLYDIATQEVIDSAFDVLEKRIRR